MPWTCICWFMSIAWWIVCSVLTGDLLNMSFSFTGGFRYSFTGDSITFAYTWNPLTPINGAFVPVATSFMRYLLSTSYLVAFSTWTLKSFCWLAVISYSTSFCIKPEYACFIPGPVTWERDMPLRLYPLVYRLFLELLLLLWAISSNF